MAKGYHQDFKNQAIADMKQSGLSVHEAAKKHKLSPKTIYAWLRDISGPTNYKDLLKEHRDLKAENKVLRALVRRFSADSSQKK